MSMSTSTTVKVTGNKRTKTTTTEHYENRGGAMVLVSKTIITEETEDPTPSYVPWQQSQPDPFRSVPVPYYPPFGPTVTYSDQTSRPIKADAAGLLHRIGLADDNSAPYRLR